MASETTLVASVVSANTLYRSANQVIATIDYVQVEQDR